MAAAFHRHPQHERRRLALELLGRDVTVTHDRLRRPSAATVDEGRLVSVAWATLGGYTDLAIVRPPGNRDRQGRQLADRAISLATVIDLVAAD